MMAQTTRNGNDGARAVVLLFVVIVLVVIIFAIFCFLFLFFVLVRLLSRVKIQKIDLRVSYIFKISLPQRNYGWNKNVSNSN